MPSSLSKHRRAAFHRQNGRCHYCGFPMWLEDPAELAIAFGLTIRDAARLQCTAEHLIARQDGGGDGAGNIVAACRFCNATRHRRSSPPDPESHRHRVLCRLNAGRWHPKQLRQGLAGFTGPTARPANVPLRGNSSG
jgi:5-methylcytosine-specific restriction endonuclease McrA